MKFKQLIDYTQVRDIENVGDISDITPQFDRVIFAWVVCLAETAFADILTVLAPGSALATEGRQRDDADGEGESL